ncbi:hypothetical protein [Halomonas ventosae]|uniref:Protein kinase domain-containing protein n=1 Tax=Halomonas ventosae TaxID=229007 RepID=A0A2T0VL19_9GAMM|nr:hypothetical protein [Halomonas ventosae]PRY70906.1 hypothetical protein BCL64_1102 [Halomonas ventosae]
MNEWIYDALLSKAKDIPDPLRGLTIFLVREEGVAYLGTIKEILFNEGFDHVVEGSIPEESVCEVARGIRGGNWGRGPYPKSGGLPSYYYVVYDAKPVVPSVKTKKVHIGLDNERILMAKTRIRDVYNLGVLPQGRCNILHSADNAAQAIDYLRLIDPGCIVFVEEVAERKYVMFSTPFKVIKELSNNARRAKVELIEFHGKKAVCKTFKEGRQRYLEREVTAREVGAELKEVSEILEVGDNYIVTTFYEGSLDELSKFRPFFHGNSYLPIWAIERMKDIILFYRARGYECVDFSPKNVVVDSNKDLKVIDFEFLQKLDHPSESLYGNLAWYPVPSNFERDVPQIKNNDSLYRRFWFRYTGLPLYFCINNFPSFVLYFVRGVTFVCYSLYNTKKKAFGLPFKVFVYRLIK